MTNSLESLSKTDSSLLAKINDIETKNDRNLLQLGEQLKKNNSKIDKISKELMEKHLAIETKVDYDNKN